MDTWGKRERNVLDLCDVKRNASYLDCGFSDGNLTLKVSGKIETKKIYGIDVDPNYLRMAKKKGINALYGNLNEKLPFKNETFDVITAIEVIEHLHNTDMFVKELFRICKKGGHVIIGTENLASWHNIFALILGFQPSTGPWISDFYSIGFYPLRQKHIEILKKKKQLSLVDKHASEDKHINVMTRDALRKLCVAYGFTIEGEKTSGFYPFSGFISDALAKLDKRHALTVVLKLRK